MKASYTAIVMVLNDIYEMTHEPEALGISKVDCAKVVQGGSGIFLST